MILNVPLQRKRMDTITGVSYARLDVSGPQSPTSPHDSRDVPEIDGSPAGFIILVVFLSSIVVISCIGIFILLRTQNPDPYERHARQVLSGNRGASLYERPLGPPGMRQKFRKLFTFGRKRDGWVRANSGDDDEWDASDRITNDRPRELDDRDTRWVPESSSRAAAELNAVHSNLGRSDTAESIELSAPSKSPPSDAPAIPPTDVPDPFSASPTSMASADRFSGREGGSAEGTPDEDGRRFSVRSGADPRDVTSVRSMRKFDSGTKFKEALDF